MTVNAVEKMSYNEFVNKLQSNGYKTTSLGANETNFEQYGNALSGNLKQQLMDSFDCEQDYELQAQVASLYNSNRSVINSGQFMNSLKSMGLNVNIEYQSTSYISDYKAGNFSGAQGNGAIAVYTISDGKGGEIKIADANGNGSLEVEEVFMNQILGDINHEITHMAGAGNVVQDSNASAVSNSASASNENTDAQQEVDEPKEEEKVSQSDFNEITEKHLKDGASLITAQNLAAIELGEYMTYTGSYFEELKEQEEKEALKEEEQLKENEEKELIA